MMTSVSRGQDRALWPAVYAGALGLFLGFSLLKFGNPVILNHLISTPKEWLYAMGSEAATNPAFTPASEIEAWLELGQPLSFFRGLVLLGGLVVISPLVMVAFPKVSKWLIGLPLAWFIWQLLAATQTVGPRLTQVTLAHFTGCLACYFLGLLVLSQIESLSKFWIGLTVGFVLVLWLGFGQHYGGLEATRRLIYEQPNWQALPPELLKRATTGRIYATLIYPNALAGVLLLLGPPITVALRQLTRSWPRILGGVLVGLLAYASLACLIWTGSKSGWLIAMILATVWVLQVPFPKSIKWGLLAGLLVLGSLGFTLKFAHYFERGATSVTARFDYWQAAWKTALRHPLMGTGPGTFAVPYAAIKNPNSEMARLCHNDYLEQASDSGFPSLLAYGVFLGFVALHLYRERQQFSDPLRLAVGLGLLSWTLQGFVEFGLYIPALAWPAWLFLGWLAASPIPLIPSTRPSDSNKIRAS